MNLEDQIILTEETQESSSDLVEVTEPEWGYVEMRDVWEMRGNSTIATAMASGLAQPRWGTSIAIPREFADIINKELQQLQLQQLVYELRNALRDGGTEQIADAYNRVYQLVEYDPRNVLRALYDEGLIK